jgi:biopolymer transport protein ExbD
MRSWAPPVLSGSGAWLLRARFRPGAQVRHVPVTLPVAQIQITPLIDVLLVLLVLGVLAWTGSHAGRHAGGRTPSQAVSSWDDLHGLTLPLRNGLDADRKITSPDDGIRIGLGLQGRLTWGGAPVTLDILTRQLHEALERRPHTEVWLSVDQALPYADVLPWLAWLQTQQVTHLTLLSRIQPAAPVTGKP